MNLQRLQNKILRPLETVHCAYRFGNCIGYQNSVRLSFAHKIMQSYLQFINTRVINEDNYRLPASSDRKKPHIIYRLLLGPIQMSHGRWTRLASKQPRFCSPPPIPFYGSNFFHKEWRLLRNGGKYLPHFAASSTITTLLMAIVVKYRTPNHDFRRNTRTRRRSQYRTAGSNTAAVRATRSQAAGNVPKHIPNPLHSLASRI